MSEREIRFENIRVDRPAPKLPTKRGSLIKVTKLDGETGKWLARLGHGEWWKTFDLTGNNGDRWARRKEIEEWKHIEIFEVTE